MAPRYAEQKYSHYDLREKLEEKVERSGVPLSKQDNLFVKDYEESAENSSNNANNSKHNDLPHFV